MEKSTDEQLLDILSEIRNWIRAANHDSVKRHLAEALPDQKFRVAYQMLDGNSSMDRVRIVCKLSPNVLFELAERCTALGLMEINSDKKRVRLFDLDNFGLIDRDKR